MATRKATGRTAFLNIVGALTASDTARENVTTADAALLASWESDGDAAATYVLGFFGDALPTAGRTAADDPAAGAWAALLADCGVSGPESDGYAAARKRIQRVRWAALLRTHTGAPWAECGRASRDAAHARALCARGADALESVPVGDGATAVRLAPKKRTTGGVTDVTDVTPVAGGPVAPTPTDLAVDAVAAATWRTTADTLHGIADRVRRGKPVDAAILAAMLADARAIVDALAPVGVDA